MDGEYQRNNCGRTEKEIDEQMSLELDDVLAGGSRMKTYKVFFICYSVSIV